MPLRDYECLECKKQWEELRRDQSDPNTCSECKSTNIKRKLTTSNFQLKGSGWYKPSASQ